MASKRSSSYTCEEDVRLCHVYLDVSSNPIVVIHPSKERFWSRVEQNYNSTKPDTIQHARNRRSLQCRMSVILKAIGKLRGAIRQVENLNQSGASEMDIYIQAKKLLLQDEELKKGFRFDHVWPIMKDIKNFAQSHGDSSPNPDPHPQLPKTHISSFPELSSSSINLSDNNAGATSSQRPIGIEKAKLKRKQDESIIAAAYSLAHKTNEMVEVMKKTNELREQRRDLKIILTDINSINDPDVRAYIQGEKARILRKRIE